MSGPWRWFMEMQWLVFWGAWAVITWLILTRTEKSGTTELPPRRPSKKDKNLPRFIRDAHPEGEDQ